MIGRHGDAGLPVWGIITRVSVWGGGGYGVWV